MELKMFKSAILAVGLVASYSSASAEAVKIAVNEWTGQHISAHITGSLIKKLGHDVEYVTAGAVPQFAAIADGSVDIQPEVWTNNVGEIYPKAVEKGDIIVLGELGLQPQEGWVYPPYMEEACPGLPAYEALYKCAEAFAAADTFPEGRLVTYPADWGTRSADLVKMIDLPFKPVPGGSEGAMVAEVNSAIAKKQPVLMMFWQPHWLFADTKLNWVKWDKPHGDCDESSQKRGKACGFQQASIVKIVSKPFASKQPKVMKLLKSLDLTNDIQNALIKEIDHKGRKLEEVVAEWVANNEATWKPWVSAAM